MQSYIAKQIIVHNHFYTQPPQNTRMDSAEEITPEVPAVILRDTIKGKVQPWQGKKANSVALAYAMRELGEQMHKKANRVYWCGDELHYTAEPSAGGKLFAAQFCRDRLCATCNWRKSIKTFFNLSQVMDAAQDERSGLDTVMLTLTVRNCSGADLSATLDMLFEGWARMTEHRRFKRAVVGYFRALEITYNADADTYHPHFHAILLVDKAYFSDPKQYLHHADWVHIWRVSARLDYDPSVRINKVKTTKDRKKKHLAEVAKYTVKDSDVVQADLADTVRVVEVLGKALYRRRLFAFGGLLLVVAKRLKMDKPEDGDLINIDEAAIREDVADVLVSYKWDFGLKNYFRK